MLGQLLLASFHSLNKYFTVQLHDWTRNVPIDSTIFIESVKIIQLWSSHSCIPAKGNGFLVTRWLTVSSSHQHWQSILAPHIAVEQFINWDSSINMSPHVCDMEVAWTGTWTGIFYCDSHPDTYPELEDSCWLMNLNSLTALWDTRIDCQDWYVELKINYLVTGRTLSTVLLVYLENNPS